MDLQTNYRNLLMSYLGEGRHNEFGPIYLVNARSNFFANLSKMKLITAQSCASFAIYLHFKGDEIKVRV